MSVSSSDFLIKSSAEDGLEGPIMVQIGSLFPGMVFDSDLQSLGSTPEVLDWDDCNEMQSMEGFKPYSYDFLQV